MKDKFKIYIDRLKSGLEEILQGDFSPDFLNVEEDELRFTKPVTIKGSAYVTNNHLIIQLSANTKAKMPCVICNEMADVSIFVKSIYYTEDVKKIKTAIFDFSDILRESILLEVPKFNECNQKNCPERASIDRYLKKGMEDQHFPFQKLQS